VKGFLSSVAPPTVAGISCAAPAGVSLAGFAVGDFVELTCDRIGGVLTLRELESEDDADVVGEDDDHHGDDHGGGGDNSGPGGGWRRRRRLSEAHTATAGPIRGRLPRTSSGSSNGTAGWSTGCAGCCFGTRRRPRTRRSRSSSLRTAPCSAARSSASPPPGSPLRRGTSAAAACGGAARRPVAIEDATIELLEAPGDDGAHVLDAAYVRHALAALPERQREAVVLRDVLGFRTGETAAALGLSRPAVESLVFRARRSLRVRLRHAAAVTVLPLALREGVAEALPGFSGPARVAATATGGGLLAKLGAAPLAAKLAAGAAAVGTAGSVALELERPPQPQPKQQQSSVRDRSAPAPAAAPVSVPVERPVAPVEARPAAVVAVRSTRSPRSGQPPVTSHESGTDRSGPGSPHQGVTTVETGEHRSGDSSGPGPGPSGPLPEPEPELITPTTVVETGPSSSSGPGSGETTAIVDTSGHGGHDGSGSGSGHDGEGEIEDGSGGGPGPG
jgi:DNA-directed RNA polymerase specialized sigma24 family protein